MTLHNPPKTAFSSIATRGSNEIVLLDAGSYPGFSNYLNQTWTFTSGDWTNTGTTLIDANGPLPPRINGIMSYDGTAVIAYGGQSASSLTGVLQDTYLWNGTSWTKQTPATVPFGRYNAAASYLAGTGLIMFGGQNLNTILTETWLWTNASKNWVLQTPATVPQARINHAMASSPTQVLMFGGQGTNSQFNDTWSYAAGNWTQLKPAVSPSIRSNSSLSYDSVNNVFVLFGGQNEYNYLPETWIYNPSTLNWSQVPFVNVNGVTPAGRIGSQMSWDPSSSRTILFGGVIATDNSASSASWAFNAAPGVLAWARV